MANDYTIYAKTPLTTNELGKRLKAAYQGDDPDPLRSLSGVSDEEACVIVGDQTFGHETGQDLFEVCAPGTRQPWIARTHFVVRRNHADPDRLEEAVGKVIAGSKELIYRTQ